MMMEQEEIQVAAIGHIAHEQLSQSRTARIYGKTRRGLFIQLPELTLYLTTDRFRGPLTINIQGEKDRLKTLQPQERIEVSTAGLVFPKSGLKITVQDPLIWQPGKAPTYRKHSNNQLLDIYDQARSLPSNHPFLPLLGSVCSQKGASGDLAYFQDRIVRIREERKSGMGSVDCAAARDLLGAGPGLTPLGDDLLLGITLAVNRANIQGFWACSQKEFDVLISTTARKLTTSISCSLLSCAAQGSGEERIIRVLDGLIASQPIPDPDLHNLLEWGSSSGIAVLAGMLLALS